MGFSKLTGNKFGPISDEIGALRKQKQLQKARELADAGDKDGLARMIEEEKIRKSKFETSRDMRERGRDLRRQDNLQKTREPIQKDVNGVKFTKKGDGEFWSDT